MPEVKAHNIFDKPRTDDVLIEENISFSDLLLSDSTLQGLKASGFIKPSPIQRKAIPLGRCGFDLIVQAKSGTGKTCVFTVIALEMLKPELENLQVLILCPTREISVQIRDVILTICGTSRNLKIDTFIGGTSLDNDKKKLKKCQIAVGAPGRVKHLISEGLMKVDAIRLFVLDEADKLMEDSFRKDVNFIYLKLPEVKQMIAASATFPSSLENFVTRYMSNPMRVSPGKDVFLLGIRQFVSVIPSHFNILVQMKNKLAELFRILSTVPFNQCLVFSNYQSRAESICNELNKKGWPAVYISGSQSQSVRLKAMSSLKEFRCRILLSTDLTSRGIDAENVNLVINLDLPYDGPTYMHRIGRAGRYGSRGLAVTIVQSGAELESFQKMLNQIGGPDFHISLFPKEKLDIDIWQSTESDFEQVSSIKGDYDFAIVKCHQVEVKNAITHEEKEKKIQSEAFSKLLGYHVTVPDKSDIESYEVLVELASKYNETESQSCFSEADNSFEIYPFELKSAICYTEKRGWDEYRRAIEENRKQSDSRIELGRIIEKYDVREEEREKDVEYEETVKRDWNEYRKTIEENRKPTESRIELDRVIKKYDVREEEREKDVEYEDNVDNNSVSCSSDDGAMYSESEESEESDSEDSFQLRQWYSMWHAQLSAVRHYGNYLKYFYYWRETLKIK